jgi:hypothetical protein
VVLALGLALHRRHDDGLARLAKCEQAARSAGERGLLELGDCLAVGRERRIQVSRGGDR